MSEEKEYRPTKEELEIENKIKSAEVRKIEAEARKAEAEAEKIEKESSKIEVDIKRSDLALEKELLDFESKKISLDKEKERHNQEKARDSKNFLYRFNKTVSADSVQDCMEVLTEWHRMSPKCDIEIIFSSPGGSIIDGFELFDFLQYLRNNGHHITTGSLGYAASMAGVLLQAGDVRWVGHQAWVMIHRAAFGAWGKTFEIEDEIKFIKRIEERILDIFTSRSNLSRSKIKRNWDRKDWWISADEAVDMKLVDEVRAILPEHHTQKKKKTQK